MRKWKKLYEFPDRHCAIYDKEDLMLQQLPHLITVMPKKRKTEVFQLLANREVKEGNEKLFKWLLNKAWRKEELIIP